MGLVAGNGITAYYQFEDCAAHFESYQGDGKEDPYRIDLHGTEGTLSLPGPMSNEPDVYFHPLVQPAAARRRPLGGGAVRPAPGADKWVRAHHRMAASMVAMLRGETPECDLVQGAATPASTWRWPCWPTPPTSPARILPLDGRNPFDTWS